VSQSRTDHAAEDATSAAGPFDQSALDSLLARLRPRLHRYCARLIG